MAAFTCGDNENLALRILERDDASMALRDPDNLRHCLQMAGVWDWSKVEFNLIERDLCQVFEISDDGLNYLTRFAYNGRKRKVLHLLDILKDEGERMRESVGESSKTLRRIASLRSVAANNNMRQSDVTNWFKPTANIHNQRGVFHHLLHICAQQDWEDVVSILEERFDIHGLPGGDHAGRTMLHWAVENSWSYALKDFSLRTRTWLNYQDKDGMTALHLACQHQNEKVVKHLLDSGASYLIKDKYGRNPGLRDSHFGQKIHILTFSQFILLRRSAKGQSLSNS